jgi:hypothetical protein
LSGARAALRELNIRPANPRGLAGILVRSSQLHSDVRERPEFQRLLTLVKQLEDR